MRENQKTGRGEGTPSLGSGVSFPRCRWTEGGMRRMDGTKNPEDRSALRVRRVTSSSAASAAIVTAIIAAPTGLLATMGITALVAVVVMPSVTRGDIDDGTARHGLIHDYWRRVPHHWGRAIHHRRRAGRVDRDGTRGVKDWPRQPEGDVHRYSRLGGAGQSENCNHCYQSEQMLCFHGRSDGHAAGVFECGSLIKKEEH
jgi:hypothetical protein